jgi:hypothetical protein
VRLAPKKSTALFAAVEDDDVQHYLEENPKSALAGAHSIN